MLVIYFCKVRSKVVGDCMGSGIFTGALETAGSMELTSFLYYIQNEGLVQTLPLQNWYEVQAMLKDAMALFPDCPVTLPLYPSPFGC